MKSNIYNTNSGDKFYDKCALLAHELDEKGYEYDNWLMSIKNNLNNENLARYLCGCLLGDYEGSEGDVNRQIQNLKLGIALIYLVCVNNNIKVVEPPSTLVNELISNVYYVTDSNSELAGEVLKYFEGV